MKEKIISEKIKISNNGDRMNDALNLTERIAEMMSLKKKERFYARLLAEEMFSMVRAIAENFNADFWLEIEGNNCTYHLLANSELDYEKRKEFISVSTKNKNSARLGIMEKIREIVEAGVYGLAEGLEAQNEYGGAMMTYGTLGMDGMYLWSMQQYKDSIKKGEDSEDWDELEKSIIANIADEVQVGVRKNNVELTIQKKF